MNVYGNRFSHCAGNGGACVAVLAQSSTTCSGIPIPINIPLPSGQEISIQITVVPSVDLGIFGKIEGCASVKVDAPKCP
jgi:hypothetical protein